MRGRHGQRQSGIKPYKAGALLYPPESAPPHHYSDIGMNDSTAAVPAESKCSVFHTLPKVASKQSADFSIDSRASGFVCNSSVATQEDDLRRKLVASELHVDQLQLRIEALTSELAHLKVEACEPSAQNEKRQPSSAEESMPSRMTSELAHLKVEACEPSAQNEKRQPSSAEESFMHAIKDVRPDDWIDEEQAVVLLKSSKRLRRGSDKSNS